MIANATGPLTRSDAKSAMPLPCDRLFQNVGENGAALRDVTEQAGVCASGYGMGIATGDIDNDGDLDVFRTSGRTNSSKT